MIVYRKGGQEFLLTTNNSRGVMKIPTSTFATAAPITTPVETETGGVPFEKVTSMTGIEQMDKLDEQNVDRDRSRRVGLVEPAGRSASVGFCQLGVRLVDEHHRPGAAGRGADGFAHRHRLLIGTAACGRSSDAPAAPAISAHDATRTARLRTSRSRDCPAPTLRALDDGDLTPEQWSERSSRGGGADAPAILGKHYDRGRRAAIHAALSRSMQGRHYQVRFDPGRVPGASR